MKILSLVVAVVSLLLLQNQLHAQTAKVCGVEVTTNCSEVAGESLNSSCESITCYSQDLCSADEPFAYVWSLPPVNFLLPIRTIKYPPGPGFMFDAPTSSTLCKEIGACSYECDYIPNVQFLCKKSGGPQLHFPFQTLLAPQASPVLLRELNNY